MLVQNSSAAQIHFIIAADNSSRFRQLKKDLGASRYCYCVVHAFDKATLFETISNAIEQDRNRTPVVLVVSYRFLGPECEVLLELARTLRRILAIECVVIEPPADKNFREKLIGLGANLFDGDISVQLQELTLH